MRKLFYENIHLTDFTATVISCEPTDKKQYRILLDATAFFPEEGGQSADKGTFNGLPVLDVQIKNDLIYHYISEPLEPGAAVTGHVDWAQRFDFMQLAQYPLLSSILNAVNKRHSIKMLHQMPSPLLEKMKNTIKSANN